MIGAVAEALPQYLARHALPEAAPLAAALGRAARRPWRHAVVVPAYRESIELFAGLLPAVRGRDALVILVVNHPQGAAAEVVAENRALLDAARALGPCRPLGDAPPAVLVEADGFDLALVDRAGPGCELPAGQGVGLARRIGFDAALALSAAGGLESRWIHTTDADATLPPRYFEAAAEAPADAVALTYPYWHEVDGADPRLARAAGLYEISLRYWVVGLASAGSTHAFSAVGSTLAVDATAYARVRGVPLRQAGEDFHLLAKLAKLGRIARPAGAPIALAGDREPRTPFGTAPAVAAIAARLEGGDFELYHHRTFALIAELLDALAGERPIADPDLEACAAELGLERMRRAAARQPDRRARQRVARQWLDGLRSVRLAHRLRDRVLGTEPWRRALAHAPFVPDFGDAGDIGLGAARRALRRLEDRALGTNAID